MGKIVILKKDVSETDRYGRLLRYVYTTDENLNEIFINKVLVEDGFAYAASYPPDISYQDVFLEAQQVAMRKEIGLWNACD